MKRLRWSAVLLGLVLAMSWAGAAQATSGQTTETTTPTTVPDTTPTTVGATTTTEPVGTTTTTTTEPGGNLKPCSPEEGLTSVSGISVDDASAHPSASAQFTVKEGCQVVVFLVSGKVTGDIIELFDLAPPDDPLFGPGDHSLTVRLPDCADFIVDLVAFNPEEFGPLGAQALMSRAKSDAVRTLSQGSAPPPDPVLDEVQGTTTNCPTQTTNGKAVTTTTTGSGQLPFTGTNAMPMLIAGLVLVAGGAVAVLASRRRSRQAK